MLITRSTHTHGDEIPVLKHNAGSIRLNHRTHKPHSWGVVHLAWKLHFRAASDKQTSHPGEPSHPKFPSNQTNPHISVPLREDSVISVSCISKTTSPPKERSTSQVGCTQPPLTVIPNEYTKITTNPRPKVRNPYSHAQALPASYPPSPA